MGGKYGKRRHTGFLYLTGIILSLFLLSGCSMPNKFRPEKSDKDILLQKQITEWENQTVQNEFQKAVLTNKKILKTLDNRKPENHSDVLLRQQGRVAQALLNQILADQTKRRGLAEQLHKTRHQLNLNAQSIDSMKTLINNLNQTIKTLETHKTRLEEQIERMKQIDLK